MTTFANRYVAIGKESTFGTAVPATAYGEVDDEGFQENFDVLVREDMNRYGAKKAIDSKHFAEGSFSMAFQPDRFTMMCLHGVMGTHAPGDTAGAGNTLAEVNQVTSPSTSLPSYTFRIGRDDNEHIYAGQVIESVSISANIGEYVMMSVNTTGQKASTSLTSLDTPSYTYTGDAAHFVGCFVNFEDKATNSAFSNLVQSIDLEIRTNRDLDNSYTLGSDTCVRAPPMQRREITGTITFHKGVLSGDVGAGDEPHYTELLQGHLHNGTDANPAISMLFRVDANNEMRIDIPKVHYMQPTTNVSGRDSQTMSVEFTALYDEVSTHMCIIEFDSEDTNFKDSSPLDMDA